MNTIFFCVPTREGGRILRLGGPKKIFQARLFFLENPRIFLQVRLFFPQESLNFFQGEAFLLIKHQICPRISRRGINIGGAMAPLAPPLPPSLIICRKTWAKSHVFIYYICPKKLYSGSWNVYYFFPTNFSWGKSFSSKCQCRK